MTRSAISRARLALLSGAALLAMAPTLAMADDSVETVVVTGTRIPRPETDLPNPVVSLSDEEIAHSGTTNLTDYLKRIPALVGSLGDVDLTGLNSGSTAAGSSLAGLNLLNLRDLGFDRTLVLQDGQRLVGSSTGDTAVDINTIPITLIKDVQVVTGGTSAIYGADGVTGVVNFIMKHDLEGINALAQAGAPQDGGAERYLLAMSVGHNFEEGTNLTLTYELGIEDHLYYTQRDTTREGGAIFFIPNPANPTGSRRSLPANIPISNGAILGYSGIGAIDVNLDGNPDFLGSGVAYDPGAPIPLNGEFTIGGNGLPLAPAFTADLLPNQQRHVGEVSASHEFSHWFKLNGEFRYAHVNTASTTEPPIVAFMPITSQNPFLPANVQAAIAGNGTAGLGPDGSALGLLSEYGYLIPGVPIKEKVSRDTFRAVVQASGDLPLPEFFHAPRYGLNFVYGQTDIRDDIENNLVWDRFAAAMDAVIDPGTGKPTCRSNIEPATTPPDLFLFGAHVFDFGSQYPSSGYPLTFTPGASSGCQPLNLFDPSADNSAALAFAAPTMRNKGMLTQTDINGFIGFDFPDWGLAGPVSVVLGGEWRRETSSSHSPPFSTVPNLFFFHGADPVKGNYDVTEGFGELSIPLIAHQSFAEELSLNGAARISDYSTSGNNWTWQYSAVYSPVVGIKFRGSNALAVRSPNIGELFAPQQSLFQQVNDPCDPAFLGQGTATRAANCSAIMAAIGVPYTPGTTPVQNNITVSTLIGGNPLLQPETARTQTLGVVLQPDLIPGFTFTLDWYRVNITNAISAPSAQSIADQCVDLSSIANPFCANVTRRTAAAGGGQPAGGISQVISTQINVENFFTQGEDFSATYHVDLADWYDWTNAGTLDFHLIGNHLDKIATTPLPGEAATDGTNTFGSPYWQVNLDVVWRKDRWTFDYNWDWYNGIYNFSRQTIASQPNVVAAQYIHAPPHDIHSVQIAYDVQDDLEVYAGVNNLFYQKGSPNDASVGIPADPTGRFFYAGVRFSPGDLSAIGL